jgi:hypothetical protein
MPEQRAHGRLSHLDHRLADRGPARLDPLPPDYRQSQQVQILGDAQSRATRRTDWSDYHHADEQFHKLVGMASVLGTAVEVYHETLAEPCAYFNPLPDRAAAQIELRPVALWLLYDGDETVEFARKPVDILHHTMFMGLTEGGIHSTSE